MNVNNIITKALSPLGYPVEPITYTGKEKIYITFNYSDERAEMFEDNKPIIDIAFMQIHLYIPFELNYMTLKKQIRAKLFHAGFSYPEITIIPDDEQKINHLIFECETSGLSESESEE